MRTVRLDTVLEFQVEAAAALEGITVSAFIRRALERESSKVLSRKGSRRLAAFIGSVCSEAPTHSSKVKEAYRAGVVDKAERWKER